MQERYNDNPDLTITLTLDDGSEAEYDILYRYPVGDRQYIAISPVEDEYMEDIYIYRYEEDEHGEPILTYIDDDEEYDLASDRFDELLDEDEFDELVEEDED